MPVGREAVLARGDTPDRSDLLGDLGPGKDAPLPGLAPWASLISNMRTCSCAAIASSFSSLRLPCSSRTPYFAVPIWKTMSHPPSR